MIPPRKARPRPEGESAPSSSLFRPWSRASLLAAVTGFQGRIRFDPAKPDGTPRKLLDVSRLTGLGWQPRIPLEEGLRRTYQWFCRSRWARPAAAVSGGPIT